MNEKQQKFLELSKQYEALKEQMKEVKPQMQELMKEIGVGEMFQDPETKVVYRIDVPKGTYISFDPINYVRTKKETEKKGSLAKKEATSAGFDL